MNSSSLSSSVAVIQISYIAYSFAFVCLVIGALGLIILVSKYWHKFNATHIFEFVVIADVLTWLILGDVGLMVVQRFLKDEHPFCYLSNFLGLASW